MVYKSRYFAHFSLSHLANTIKRIPFENGVCLALVLSHTVGSQRDYRFPLFHIGISRKKKKRTKIRRDSASDQSQLIKSIRRIWCSSLKLISPLWTIHLLDARADSLFNLKDNEPNKKTTASACANFSGISVNSANLNSREKKRARLCFVCEKCLVSEQQQK